MFADHYGPRQTIPWNLNTIIKQPVLTKFKSISTTFALKKVDVLERKARSSRRYSAASWERFPLLKQDENYSNFSMRLFSHSWDNNLI